MFHDVDKTSKARDNKRLTSKENKGEEALHSKNDEKEMLASIEMKGEVREPGRLTLHDEKLPVRIRTFAKRMANTEATASQIQTANVP